MTSSQRSSLTLTHKVVDLVALVSAFTAAAAWVSFANLTHLRDSVMSARLVNVIFFVVMLVGWNIGLSSLLLYRSKRLANWRHELGDSIKGTSLCSLMLAAVTLVAQWDVVTRDVLLGFWLLGSAMMFVMRMAKRGILRQFRLHGRNLRRMVIVGTGARAQQVAEMIADHPELGYQLIGFIDNVNEPGVLGPLDQMAQILSKNVVDEMLIALPIKTFYEEMANIVQIAEDQGVTVRMLSDLFNLRLARAVADQLEDTPIISLYTGPQINWMMTLKRVIDVIGATVLITILAPVLAIIALLIKLTSRGPVFFIQERVGYNKRRFRMFKFRTMVPDAEQRQDEVEHLNEVSGPVFKIRNDPRVTPIGAFLRKTSLDELPQFFNVLRGDLSLVGPRPMSVRDFERFHEFWFNRRFSVKPGITCIWQVSGRSQTSFDQWIQQDLDYIDNWSLALDLKILCKTIPAVMRGTGAM